MSKILAISDIHGNCEALRAILRTESDFDEVVFLGDAVSPGPQPNETIELLAELPGIHILGNHDLEMFDATLTDQWPSSWRAFNDWVREQLTEKDWRYLRSLKSGGEFTVGSQRITLHHGYVPGNVRHLVPDSEDSAFQMLGASNDSDFVLFGHSHIQFRKTVAGLEYINVGSVGQNRCGKLLACYGVIQDGVFEHRQVSYDPTPWLYALDQVETLNGYPELRKWFRDSLLTGFGTGQKEPWISYAAQGYS